ncbi:unnamed protein product [Peniophora sp. CBMAI 1063]|nr:unnamed protein product [Peniophora sp. CBMAI 1063]
MHVVPGLPGNGLANLTGSVRGGGGRHAKSQSLPGAIDPPSGGLEPIARAHGRQTNPGLSVGAGYAHRDVRAPSDTGYLAGGVAQRRDALEVQSSRRTWRRVHSNPESAFSARESTFPARESILPARESRFKPYAPLSSGKARRASGSNVGPSHASASTSTGGGIQHAGVLRKNVHGPGKHAGRAYMTDELEAVNRRPPVVIGWQSGSNAYNLEDELDQAELEDLIRPASLSELASNPSSQTLGSPRDT